MAEEYCWAITHSAGPSCRGRSRASVLEFGSQLFVVPARTVARMHIQLRLVQNTTCAPPAETSLLRKPGWCGVGWGGVGVSAIFSESYFPFAEDKVVGFNAYVITSFHLAVLVGFVISCCLTSLRSLPLTSAKFCILYSSVSQPPGRGPVPGPGISYTGPGEVLLELITNLNVIFYLSTFHIVHTSVLILYYVFFWVFPRRLNYICRRFETLYLFHLHRQVV